MSVLIEKRFRQCILFCLLALCTFTGSAQQDILVRVQVNRLPNGQFPTKLYQFTTTPGLVAVTLTNRGSSAHRLYLNGSLTGDNGVLVKTKKDYLPGTIDLKPFETKVLNAIEIGNLFNTNGLVFQGSSQNIRPSVMRDQGLPEGTYQVCVRAYDPANRQPLSEEEPLGCSNIFSVSILEAPVILSPIDQETMKSFIPQNLVFRWTTPPGAPPSVRYTIRIVEAFKGADASRDKYFQPNPNEAFSTTRQSVFETTVTSSTVFLYGPAQPPLVVGRPYAMIVTAEDPMQNVQFRNNGQSSAVLFRYGNTADDVPAVVVAANGDTLHKTNTIVKGRLLYRFENEADQQLFPVAHEQIYLQKVFVKQDNAGGITQYSALTAGEQNSLPPYQEMLGGIATQTDADGNFELHVGMTALDNGGLIPKDKWDLYFPAGKSDQLKGQLACLYKVVSMNPHYKPSGEYLQIMTGGERDLSNVVLNANSYTLRVNVVEVFNNQKGNFAAGADVKIYRFTSFKKNPGNGIPLYEGDLLDSSKNWQESGDKVLIAARTTGTPARQSTNAADYAVYFPRLFRSNGSAPDNYLICLEKGGVVLQQTTFSQIKDMIPAAAFLTVNQPAANAATAAAPASNTFPAASTPAASTTALRNNRISALLSMNSGLMAGSPGVNKLLSPGAAAIAGSAAPAVAGASPAAATGIKSAIDKWIDWGYKGADSLVDLTLEKELVVAPRSHVTGVLQYAFKNDNSTPVKPYANMPVKLVVYYLFGEKKDGSTAPAGAPAGSGSSAQAGSSARTGSSAQSGSSAQTGSSGLGTATSFTMVKSGQTSFYALAAGRLANQDPPAGKLITSLPQGVTTINNLNDMAQLLSPFNPYHVVSDQFWAADNGKALQTVYTDGDGRFNFDFENADSTMTVKVGSWASGSGDLVQMKEGRLMRVYRVVPAVSYYCAPDNDVSVQPWKDFDCGTLTSFVHTYNLNVHITDKNAAPFGANVPVKLYRSANNPYLDKLPAYTAGDINRRMGLSDAPAGPKANKNDVAQLETATVLPQYYLSGKNQNTSLAAQAAANLPGSGITLVSAKNPINQAPGNNQLTKTSAKNQMLTPVSGGQSYQTAKSGVSVIPVFPSYILKRQGMTLDNSIVNFKNLVVSLDRQNDSWLVQADGDATLRDGTISFATAYLEFPKKYETPEYTAVANKDQQNLFGPSGWDAKGKTVFDENTVMFNSDMDPNATYDAWMLIQKNPPRIAGRVIDGFSFLGIPNIQVRVEEGHHPQGGSPYIQPYYANTDANGYFDVKSYSAAYKDLSDEDIRNMANDIGSDRYLIIEAPGYEPKKNPLKTLLQGQQSYDPMITLKPLGTNCFGYVVDAADSNIAVTARVKLKVNGRWVDTYAYSGDKYKPSTKSPYWMTDGLYTQMIGTAVHTAVAGNVLTPAGSGMSTFQAGNLQLTVDRNLTVTNVKQTSNPVLSLDEADALAGQRTAIKDAHDKFATQPVGQNGNWGIYFNAVSQQADPGVTVKNDLLNSGVIAQLKGNYASGMQRFDIDLPAKPDSILVMPYDPAYLTVTMAVNAKGAQDYLGLFRLQKRKHKVRVMVMESTATGFNPVTGAMVSIDGISGIQNSFRGSAYFEFVNNATKDFTLRVQPAKNQAPGSGAPAGTIVFVPRTMNFQSEDDGSITTLTIKVDPGKLVSGKVTFKSNGQPVKGATVFVDQGKGSNSEIATITGEDGSYVLTGIPEVPGSGGQGNDLTIKAGYMAPGKTYIGDAQTVAITAAPAPAVNLTIGEVTGIDISHLLGMPARIENIKEEGNGVYTIDGELFNLPENGNFSMRKNTAVETVLPFHQIRIRTSATRNTAGIPVGVPAGDAIDFDSRQMSIGAYDIFNAQLSAADGSYLRITKNGADTTGLIRGRVRIMDNSFNFPSSYMTISSQDFYLGNPGQAASAAKLQIPVFRSGSSDAGRTKFSITDGNAAGIVFKYLGFDGITETQGSRESFVLGDSVTLFMNLTTTIPGNIKLNFNSGTAVIHQNGLSRMITNDSIRFNLEQWTVASNQWELSPLSGGIVLRKGTLYTGKADLPFTDMAIIPGDLSCPSLTSDALRAAASRDQFTIGGGLAKLRIYGGTDVAFGYDPDVGMVPGQGHYKLSLRSDAGKAAWFGNMDGMTDSRQRFNIQYLSVLSNGEEQFAFDPLTPPVTFYNQMQYSAQRMFSYADRLVLEGLVSMGIPGVPDNIGGTFSFFKANSGKLSISPLQFSFTGNGGCRFVSANDPGKTTQRFDKYGIGIAGDITLPDGSMTLKSNLLSMVTAGANDLVTTAGNAASAGNTAVQTQIEIITGNALGTQAQGFADAAQDHVNGVVADVRKQLQDQLNNARNTLEQSLPMGSSQEIANVAGKWRLAGEGIDAIQDLEHNPAGSLLRLNGVFKGFTGIDVKEESKMVVNNALKGMQENLPIEKMNDGGAGFSGMKFDFDLKNGRIMGSLNVDELNFGAVVLTDLGIELLMDKEGWYFYAGAGLDFPEAVPIHTLIFPLATGMLIGDYPRVTPALESRVTQTSYVKKLPATYKQGVHGFFFTGKKEILPEVKLGVDFGIVDFEIAAVAGLDARFYANFGGESQQVGIGVMAFGNAYARLAVLGGLCGVEGSAKAELGIKISVTNDRGGLTFAANGCASLSVAGRAWCAIAEGGFDESIMALISLCAGHDCQKAVDFSIKFGGGSCTSGNDFDY